MLRFDGDAAEAAHLRDLGLREGSIVTVLREGDPLVVKVSEARVGIGRAAAMNVLCELEQLPPASPQGENRAHSPAMQSTLDTMQAGQKAVVKELRGEPATIERLMEMGLVAGTPLQLLKFAPLGDPIEIVVRGYHLSVRRAEAAGIVVEI